MFIFMYPERCEIFFFSFAKIFGNQITQSRFPEIGIAIFGFVFFIGLGFIQVVPTSHFIKKIPLFKLSNKKYFKMSKSQLETKPNNSYFIKSQWTLAKIITTQKFKSRNVCVSL